MCLDAAKFVFLSIRTLIETNCEKFCKNRCPIIQNAYFAVDLRRSEMSSLELPNICMHVTMCLDPYNVHAFNIGPLITCIYSILGSYFGHISMTDVRSQITHVPDIKSLITVFGLQSHASYRICFSYPVHVTDNGSFLSS